MEDQAPENYVIIVRNTAGTRLANGHETVALVISALFDGMDDNTMAAVEVYRARQLPARPNGRPSPLQYGLDLILGPGLSQLAEPMAVAEVVERTDAARYIGASVEALR